MEFLVTLTVTIPAGTDPTEVEQRKADEAARAAELIETGNLLRIWTPPSDPGVWTILGLWEADDPTELRAMLESLPLWPWITEHTEPLGAHPNDPGRLVSGAR
ncbi:muconolactone Delta-isomerase family protein [Solirubrobacter ginsenosidimutans]|uniref:Muconolactone Delta-isomerase family protein n=1 Tax=Solirubrobacter ginsenosidimutans TaxID=490573 RepID=A0A9X3MN06_9ACTN|nr:muconolactone Delta-isomerase family protein [Solirubrobacter ginsenosidimutans]MDA0159115.1 muconolactone Delta-isomerase family protein [Solirubrobacter ginsenosidimutans]